MKLSFITSLIVSQLVFLSISNCSNADDKQNTCTEKQALLNEKRARIRSFAEASICNETYECRFIAFGNKPCGGPWEYLVYTTSIDTLEFENLVSNFNILEAKYNQECGAISDCMMVMPPSGLECENNKCIPIY
ncbi:MAG TPA: hypothetical protein VKY41_04865 [Xanthomarina sp.]|nr:hypothetical protein [Xanthomarina sp.]